MKIKLIEKADEENVNLIRRGIETIPKKNRYS